MGRDQDRKIACPIVECLLKRNQVFRLEPAVTARNVVLEMIRTCDNGAVCYSDLSRSDIPL
jgi:hypothetical protein